MDVALVTCAKLHEVDPDDAVLLEALGRRGLRAGTLVWDARDADWSKVGVAVIRSTWDYHERREEFLAWAERASRATRLLNDVDTVRWNTHKFYLRELEARGVPIVPTEWIAKGTRVDLGELLRARGWSEIVVKPAVSAASHDTIRADGSALVHAQAHVDRLARSGDALVQPFVASVDEDGELSLVFIDGTFMHAVQRPPGLGAPFERLSDSRPAAPPARAIDLARSILVATGRAPLYARVDLVRDAAGHHRLLELELVEPTLFFRNGPEGAEAMANALHRLVGPSC